MDISRQQEREPFVLTLEQEEQYFNSRVRAFSLCIRFIVW